MSLKSISKTRWKVHPDSITIYPYGLSYILAAVLAFIFVSGYFVYLYYLHNSVDSSMPLLITLVAVIALFIAWAGTSVEFDVNNGIMRRKLMGILPVSSIPFSRIYGISPVTDTLGSYKYKVFKKENRYGKGLLVSCAYGKNDDPNAIAFVNEVITPIHQLLAAYDAPDDFKAPIIDNYEFFNVVGGAYTIKKNKIGSILFGLILLVIGIHELTPGAWLGHEINLGRLCFLMFMLIGGTAIILAGFTEVTFDRSSRLLTRKNPIGWGNKTYSFDDYNGVQTVRKSTNLIYTGTDVQVYFLKPQSQKEDVLVLQSFFSTRKVERFIAEVNTIMM